MLILVFRYDPFTDSYHDDMAGDGLICLAVDILPTEFPKEVGFPCSSRSSRGYT